MIKIKKVRLLSLVLLLFIPLLNFNFVEASNRVVEDMIGRKVQLPEKINRIITTYKSATHFIFDLGAQDRLVGCEAGKCSDNKDLFNTLMPEIKEIPSVGSKKKGVNLEEIIALQPDLVILYPYNDGPEVAKKLALQGIASIIINPESLREIRETNLLLGKALHLEEKAKEIDKKYEKILQLVERTSKLTINERKTVYFANSELTHTIGKDMLQTSLIELAGGINPAKETKSGFIEISPEQLVKWNPDVMVVSQFYLGKIKELKNLPEYQSIKAFQNESIYRFPSNIEPWDFPSSSSFLAIIWLSQKLYPEKYTEIELDKVINDFYITLYGKSFTELGGKIE